MSADSEAHANRAYDCGVCVRWALLVAFCACGRVDFDPLRDAAGSSTDDGLAGGDGATVRANIVFLTSSQHSPASLGGLTGADAICAMRANEAGLTGTFVAWLSTSTVNAVDRLAGARGWMRTDGAMVADTPADLAANKLVYAITLDENGIDRAAGIGTNPGYVLTATDGGTLDFSDCGNFMSTAGTTELGTPFSTHFGWSARATLPCDTTSRLYCFQIDRNVPLSMKVTTGRLAFVSTADFTPSSGIAAADAI